MTTEIEYALMAGRAYQITRDKINRFPIPGGWSEFFHVPDPANPSFQATDGFEAVSFKRGTEIVISYAGTYDNPLNPTNPDLQADLARTFHQPVAEGSSWAPDGPLNKWNVDAAQEMGVWAT